MLRRDYLMRMVEDMTQMIAKVFALKQERKHTEALWELDDMLRRQFRLNSKLLRSLSASDIEQLFYNHGYLEADRLQGAARLLEEEAEIEQELGREDEAVHLYTKVLQLYLKSALNGADPGLFDLPGRIRSVKERLRAYELPARLVRDDMAYAEQEGRYADAENLLYQLLQSGGIDADEATRFYHRLLLKPAEELERGQLPLAEVHEGMEELSRRFMPGKQEELSGRE
ncbi:MULTISPECIES: DUF6483 family protein [Paenibacillus]|uniref:Uncharacterized protein n=2 Tax=Paenibacillus lactis TaxID=228574 RepID=G4HKJ0_9BACL|nr:DUF6483 family protein [Paenibacillus lactis]EHB59530.1 hypothetical protein PaelaDRAFT_4501 [Paenibacillus lactis 154]MBP1896610.1 hypothetical protein [Paenibacillus lactis]HAF98061.1 hypothetical protein [Paenibacillus lactis]